MLITDHVEAYKYVHMNYVIIDNTQSRTSKLYDLRISEGHHLAKTGRIVDLSIVINHVLSERKYGGGK